MVTVEDIVEVVNERSSKKKKTTSNESWKAFERRTASDFNTTRTPLSGMVKTITNSDTLHPKLYIECKYRGDDFTFWESFEKLRKENPQNLYVLCVHPKGRAMVHLYHNKDFFDRVNGSTRKLKIISNKKYRGICTLFEQTIDRAELEEKLPIISIKKKGGNGYIIGVAPGDYKEIEPIVKQKFGTQWRQK